MAEAAAPVAQQQASLSSSSSSNSLGSAPGSSVSLVILDELSSFGATKNGRLPALIKLGEASTSKKALSMPPESAQELEEPCLRQKTAPLAASLPAQAIMNQESIIDKENSADNSFQMLETSEALNEDDQPLRWPSLPQAPRPALQPQQLQQTTAPKTQTGQQSLLGDSLIEMIVNLRQENQNLVRALETNNEYVKERISEFKRLSEDSRKREAKFALERAEFEHQSRKLKRQNAVLGERLRSMEAKLRDLRLEAVDSLAQASSSKASSLVHQVGASDEPGSLGAGEPSTMQVDQTGLPGQQGAAQETGEERAKLVSGMDREQMARRFEASKGLEPQLGAEDPMKVCDLLEQRLNSIGKRDYEICLLQQQLNIYRQDYRMERMANLEAQIQIERLKCDIERLCMDRLTEQSAPVGVGAGSSRTPPVGADQTAPQAGNHRVSFGASGLPDGHNLGALGQHLSRRAAKHVARAAKRASKLAHREEKAAAWAAATSAAAAKASASASSNQAEAQETGAPNPGRRHHGHGASARSQLRAVRDEVVSDLLSTANKAMLTGYKMASTHVNLALDKLSQFEQSQASHLAANKAPPSAPAGPPSID